MKFKAALKYQLYSVKKSLIIFYIVIYAIIITLSILQIARPGNINTSIGGFESASAIFLFVTGLNCYKPTFHLMLANGVSRRTMFNSFSVMILPVAAGMALIDSLNNLVFSSIVNYRSMFKQFYGLRYGIGGAVPNTFQVVIEGFLWMLVLYASVAMIGYFITALYYRMNKPIKLVVSIGVPVFFLILLPIIDNVLILGVNIIDSIWTFLRTAWGLADGINPYIGMISSVLTYAAFGVLSFLTIRKATVKQS